MKSFDVAVLRYQTARDGLLAMRAAVVAPVDGLLAKIEALPCL